jgi:hypothetical protein
MGLADGARQLILGSLGSRTRPPRITTNVQTQAGRSYILPALIMKPCRTLK